MFLNSKNKIYFRSNTAQEASNTRNALANGLYSRLFDYIINSINKLLSYSLQVYGGVSTIGILDIFGFENMLNNSFEQLCINTASEQMEFYFNQASPLMREFSASWQFFKTNVI